MHFARHWYIVKDDILVCLLRKSYLQVWGSSYFRGTEVNADKSKKLSFRFYPPPRQTGCVR
jgi:hypothetical protein